MARSGQPFPKLRAIRRAADREGLRLQLLLRLAPISPVSVSYVLGASGVRFSTFLIATAGLIPGLFKLQSKQNSFGVPAITGGVDLAGGCQGLGDFEDVTALPMDAAKVE